MEHIEWITPKINQLWNTRRYTIYLTTLFTLLNVPTHHKHQALQDITPVNIKTPSFDRVQFHHTIEQIRQDALQKLQQYEPESKREISYNDTQRSLTQQAVNHKTWASETLISLHNIGAAADYIIYKNNTLLDGTTYKEMKYYQILWWSAHAHGLFWWLPRDIWHVATSRRVHETLEQYPELCNHPNIIEFYEKYKNDHTMDIKYEPLMSLMDQHTWNTQTRTYTGTYKKDILLDPFYPSSK